VIKQKRSTYWYVCELKVHSAVMNGCSMGGKKLFAVFVKFGHKMRRLQEAVGPTGLQM